MSKENLEHFMKQVADSKELQAKIGAEITGLPGFALVALGAAHGCEFSIADVQAGAELSDAELEGVSGGVRVLRFRLFRLFSTVFPAALHLWTSSVWVVMPRPAPVKLK